MTATTTVTTITIMATIMATTTATTITITATTITITATTITITAMVIMCVTHSRPVIPTTSTSLVLAALESTLNDLVRRDDAHHDAHARKCIALYTTQHSL